MVARIDLTPSPLSTLLQTRISDGLPPAQALTDVLLALAPLHPGPDLAAVQGSCGEGPRHRVVRFAARQFVARTDDDRSVDIVHHRDDGGTRFDDGTVDHHDHPQQPDHHGQATTDDNHNTTTDHDDDPQEGQRRVTPD